ncbi:MAG TPA: hypothetical protein VMS65_01175, partial [Polyangiaceae bacterium]|nr:hypothetical protein [Polyangiaceae bacterium]
QGPSAVAQGHYFSTGNPQYDEFFVRLHRMQVELKAAPETLASVRSDLARSLALEPNADAEAIRGALTKKAGELNARGAVLIVDRGRAPGALSRLAVTGTVAQTDREVVKTLGDAFARVGEVRGRFGVWQGELEWLPPAGATLDGSVEAAFVGQSRGTRDDVHENLVDAQKVVALMTTRVKEIEATSAELDGIFVSAFGENRHEPAPSPEPETKPKPRPASRAEAPARKASPSAEDETPAAEAKPKQGTARPDFEP